MGPIGVQEMIGIFLVALLLFGPKKLPELGRMLGKGFREFRRMKAELRSTLDTHMQELEREIRLSETPTYKPLAPPTDYSSVRYPYPYEETAPYSHSYENPAEPFADSSQVQSTAAEGTQAAVPIPDPFHPEPSASSAVPGTVARNGATQAPLNGTPVAVTPNPLDSPEQERPA